MKAKYERYIVGISHNDKLKISYVARFDNKDHSVEEWTNEKDTAVRMNEFDANLVRKNYAAIYPKDTINIIKLPKRYSIAIKKTKLGTMYLFNTCADYRKKKRHMYYYYTGILTEANVYSKKKARKILNKLSKVDKTAIIFVW